MLNIDLTAGGYWISSRPGSVPIEELETPGKAEKVIADEYSRPTQLPDNLRFIRVQVGDDYSYQGGTVSINFHQDGSADAAFVQISNQRETHTLLIHRATGRGELVGEPIDQLPE